MLSSKVRYFMGMVIIYFSTSSKSFNLGFWVLTRVGARSPPFPIYYSPSGLMEHYLHEESLDGLKGKDFFLIDLRPYYLGIMPTYYI